MTNELANLIRTADKLHSRGYDVFFGLNTRDMRFSVTVAKHPYEYGGPVLGEYKNMRLNLADLTVVNKRLMEIDGTWIQERITPAARPE